MAAADEMKWIVQNGDIEKVKVFCSKKGFDVNADLGTGRAPIHFAADYGQESVLEYLCSIGANVNLPDKHGITPLLAAIYEGHVECVKLLIQKGANKNGESPSGDTYLKCADSDEIKQLLQ